MVCDFEYKLMNTKMLTVDKSYQRDTDMTRVRSIVREWNPCLVHAVKVSKRDGKYYIFDGQHTVEALKLKNKGFDTQIWCQVFNGLTWLDEVELFLAQNGNSRAVKMNDKFRARMNAGDEDVVKMVRSAEALGIIIDFKGSKAYNKIVALTTLARIFKNTTEKEYTRILKLIRDTWGGVQESYSSEILKGVFVFLKAYGDEFKDANFRNRLGRVSPSVIIREAKASAAPGDSKYARQILAVYNQGTRTSRLPDKL